MEKSKKGKKPYDYLVVGTGIFGAVFAYMAKQKGKTCLLIDKRPHTGGNIYCDSINSINVHKYGAHIFHTANKEVWDFVNSFVEFNHYINSPLANYEGKLYNLPFNMNTFCKLWGVNTPAEAMIKLEEQRKNYADIVEPANLEEQALKLCGEDIYNIFIKGYTEKQWGRSALELPAFIIKRIPFRFTFDNNYFNDPYQGIPKGGYNKLTDGLLEGIEVRLDTNYFYDRDYFDSLAEKVIFTGRIDEFFGFEYGELEYRGLHFEHKCLETDNYQGNAVVNYNERKVPYTRIIEHKHFEFGTQPTTVITHEYPGEFAKDNEPYYPINDERNTVIYKKYKEKADQIPHLYIGGRLGQYAYFDMDDSVEAAMNLAKKELK
ncbi:MULTISPECIES: UDP-galactopyranose mutase [unclassified Dysgonomonas]|uniref:UDP-galactopyranose mutase n=1 Tax=unclassified Dysgonomonas TaxID=2630389 RepID=UPI0013E9B37B|nr:MULTISPECIES: UDP-galactopyranose mutase [unclassified Dysgonomonas]